MAESRQETVTNTPHAALKVWTRFCDRFRIAESSVPLFETAANGVAATRPIGRKNPRTVLMRSAAMESMMRAEACRAIADLEKKRGSIDGLIYIMCRIENSSAIPLYIGKAGIAGKTPGKLSANMTGLNRDTGKFCRWGDNYAYHIGDLSAVVLGHSGDRRTQKYRRWADALFDSYPTDLPLLKGDVRFWCTAWSNADTGIWEDFGPVGLKFLEYLLIGVAGTLFPQHLLNSEGN